MKDVQDTLNIDEYIPCQLTALSKSIGRPISALYEKCFEISITECKVLAVVEKMPGLSAIDVAQYAGLDTVSVSRAVTKLVDIGHLLRDYSDEDRRRLRLELTDSGHEAMNKITQLAASLQSSLIENLTDEEKNVLEKVLGSFLEKSSELTDQVSAIDPGASKPFQSYGHPKKPADSNDHTSLLARYLSGIPALRQTRK